MLIKELFADNGAFSYFATLPSYKTVLGDLDPNILDCTMILLYGERKVMPLPFDDVTKLYECVWTDNKDGWQRIWQAWNAEYDVLSSKMQTTNVKSNHTDNTDTNSETIGKTAAYDSDTLLNDTSGTVSDTSTKTTEDSSLTETFGTYGVPHYKAILDEIKMRRNNVVRGFVEKVASYLTLDIY